jgi:Flp pilus assembly protein TadD
MYLCNMGGSIFPERKMAVARTGEILARWLPWLGLAVLGLALRFLYLAEFSGSPLCQHPFGPDVQEYAAWAREILAGRLLWPEVRIHSPLYPYFLAALYALGGLSHLAVRIVQSALVLAAVVPLLLAMRLAGTADGPPIGQRRTLLLAGALWAAYPPLIYHGAELVSEALLVPLLGLALWLLHRAESRPERAGTAAAIGAGLATALAVLCHPLALFLLIGEGLWLSLTGRPETLGGCRTARRRAIAYLGAAGLALTPVVTYNTLILRGPPLQANGGFNFWLGNGPDADGTCRLRPGPDWDQAHRQGAASANARGIGKDLHFLTESLAEMTRRPGNALRLLAAKALYAVNVRELTAGADAAPLREATVLMRRGRGAFALLGIAAITLLLLRGRDPAFLHACRHFLILGGAFWAGQILFVAAGRYRLGMLPALVPLAALGIVEVADRLRGGGRRARINAAIAVAVAATVVLLPRPPSRPEREHIEADTILAEAWLAADRADQALPLLRANVRRQPEWSRHRNLLGLALRRLGQHDEAAALFRTATEVAPNEPEAWMNLAVLHADHGRHNDADAAFAQAFVVASPPAADLEYNHALFRQRLGDLAGAEEGYRAALTVDAAHRPARANLGTVLLLQGRPREAAAEFAVALRLAPGDLRLRVNYAAALAADGKTGQARRELARVQHQDPDLPAARELQRQLE